jgi:glycosyltransferase involved in cell wall biosynthesis
MNRPSCSLIISTYNWPGALDKSLQSVYRQTVLPDEIIIADDGSGSETRELILKHTKASPVPIRHVWHEDEGFRLAEIRNKGFVAATCDYIIQIDGDHILHPGFIGDHLRFRSINTFVSGTRCLLHEDLSSEILAADVLPALPLKDRRMEKKHNSIRSRMLSQLFYALPGGARDVYYVIGGNMAFWKKDLISVNGYNEAFKGWGKEDNDLAIRLRNAGLKLHFIKFGAIVYHLEHRGVKMDLLAQNESLLAETQAKGLVRAALGMDRHV